MKNLKVRIQTLEDWSIIYLGTIDLESSTSQGESVSCLVKQERRVLTCPRLKQCIHYQLSDCTQIRSMLRPLHIHEQVWCSLIKEIGSRSTNSPQKKSIARR